MVSTTTPRTKRAVPHFLNSVFAREGVLQLSGDRSTRLNRQNYGKNAKNYFNCKSWVKMGLRCQSDDRSDHLPL